MSTTLRVMVLSPSYLDRGFETEVQGSFIFALVGAFLRQDHSKERRYTCSMCFNHCESTLLIPVQAKKPKVSSSLLKQLSAFSGYTECCCSSTQRERHDKHQSPLRGRNIEHTFETLDVQTRIDKVLLVKTNPRNVLKSKPQLESARSRTALRPTSHLQQTMRSQH